MPGQQAQQFRAVQPWHPQIGDDAALQRPGRKGEKRLGTGEALSRQPIHIEQEQQRIPHRVVVIDDIDGGGAGHG